MQPTILFESDHLLAVNKPAGWVTERSAAYPSVEEWAWEYLAPKMKKPMVGVVHRLDRPVSGVLLLAKKKIALQQMNEQFRLRRVRKTYLAIVAVAPPAKSGVLEQWLIKDQKHKLALLRDQPSPEATPVKLHYRLISEVNGFFLLEVHPHTGKFHQIRAQLAHLGCPIVGDERYGGPATALPEVIGLHAFRLSFTYPFLREEHHLEGRPPQNIIWEPWQGL